MLSSTTSYTIRISNWKPHEKNTLKGFFTVSLPSGMVIHRVMLHQDGANRWVAFPSREWQDDRGTKQYAKLIEFTDRKTSDRFRDQVLNALDHFLGNLPQKADG